MASLGQVIIPGSWAKDLAELGSYNHVDREKGVYSGSCGGRIKERRGWQGRLGTQMLGQVGLGEKAERGASGFPRSPPLPLPVSTGTTL